MSEGIEKADPEIFLGKLTLIFFCNTGTRFPGKLFPAILVSPGYSHLHQPLYRSRFTRLGIAGDNAFPDIPEKFPVKEHVDDEQVSNTLDIVDASNPAKPVQMGSITGVGGNKSAPTNGQNAVYVSGSYAYVAGQYANALWIVEIGTISGTSFEVQSPSQISCTFDLTGKPAVQYNVVVTNPD